MMKHRPKVTIRRLRVVDDPRPPAPAARDRTYGEIGDELAAISVELAAAQGDRLTAGELAQVRAAFTCVNQAAVALLTLDEELHKLRVQSLDDRCRCGWDRGSHMVAPPHLCEEDARCPGFQLASFETESARPAPGA
jgi:hypothetical protein